MSQNNRYFQWLATERKGEVVIFNDIVQEDGIDYITFRDGSRINSELVAEINVNEVTGKVMAEVESPNNVWKFKEVTSIQDSPRVEQDWESQTKYEVPTADEIAFADLTGQQGTTKPIPKKKKIELIPPRPTKNKFGKIANTADIAEKYNEEIDSKKIVEKIETKIVEKPPIDMSDPVNIMMEKSKKIDTEVNMTLTISLPSKHLFDVAAESFDDGDKKALEYIIENIDISEIKKSLKEGIKEMYGIKEIWGGIGPKIEEEKKIEITNDKPGAIDPTQIFKPEVIEEPVVRSASEEEISKEELEKLLKKAEKINIENG